MTHEFLSDRFLGCLVGLSVGDAMGRASDGMTPYEVMLAYRTVDGFFGRPGVAPGEPGQSSALAEATCTALRSASLSLTAASLSSCFSSGTKWSGQVAESIRSMASGKPFQECGQEPDDPAFLPCITPVGLVAAAKEVDDVKMWKASQGLTLGFTKSKPAAVAAYCLSLILREVVRDFENIDDPQDLYDGKESLLRRVASRCASAEAECCKGELEQRLLAPRMEFVIRNLQRRTSLREFVLVNGTSTSTEVVSSCLFSFCREPESFHTLSRVVSMGGKASLCGAVVGALVGAYTGASSSFLPKEMRNGLKNEAVMESLAKELATEAARLAPRETKEDQT